MLVHKTCNTGVFYDDLCFDEDVHEGVIVALDSDIRTSDPSTLLKLVKFMTPCFCVEDPQYPQKVQKRRRRRSKRKIDPDDWFDEQDILCRRKSNFFRDRFK
jgi:hypothetical protein